ncbi:MAG: hypothetical protein IPJ90_03360 [Anaerolineaceae bacterium]|nr:hypothetical protein [Anaerolineaceae bacterium]
MFREANIRRAFSAAIDRQFLVEEVFGNAALPMRHLLPPGVVGAPPVDQVGFGPLPRLCSACKWPKVASAPVA